MIDIETKSKLLNSLGLNAQEVGVLAECSRTKAYKIMQVCRSEFNGQAGLMTNLITPKSLCLALGTTLEDELHNIAVIKGQKL